MQVPFAQPSAYFFIHLYYTVPAALLLHYILKPIQTRRDAFKTLFLIGVALIYTTPFDSFLIRSKIWSYPGDSVMATVWSIPLEEYFFFVIQTYITASLYLILTKPIFFPAYLNPSARLGFFAWSMAFSPVGLSLLLTIWEPKSTYLAWILLWSAPILALLLLFTYSTLIVLPRYTLCSTILLPTIYLWVIDNIALHRGIWTIEKPTKLDYQIFGSLDLEEAVFFLITNTMICLGLVGCDKVFAIMDTFPMPFLLDLPSTRALIRKLVLDLSFSELCYLTSVTEASLILKEKSKGFHFASMIFPSPCRHSLTSIYAVCRVMDDSIDNAANLLLAEQFLVDVKSYIKTIASSTHHSKHCEIPELRVTPPKSDGRTALILFPAILRYIPPTLFLQLVQGFETDLRFSKATHISQFPIQTENDLITYCRCVASTVAQMFVHAVWKAAGTRPDTSDQRDWVLEKAAQMGIALQLVNIARDIIQDAYNGRSYIPLEWANSEEKSELVELIKDPRNPAVVLVTRKYSMRLVRMARSYYLQAEKGLAFLPPEYIKGARLTLDVYMAIGEKISQKDGDISQRVSLDTKQKIRIAAKVLYK